MTNIRYAQVVFHIMGIVRKALESSIRRLDCPLNAVERDMSISVRMICFWYLAYLSWWWHKNWLIKGKEYEDASNDGRKRVKHVGTDFSWVGIWSSFYRQGWSQGGQRHDLCEGVVASIIPGAALDSPTPPSPGRQARRMHLTWPQEFSWTSLGRYPLHWTILGHNAWAQVLKSNSELNHQQAKPPL